MNKKIVIFGGGTVHHVMSHLALAAPAYGTTAKKLADYSRELLPNLDTELILTRMAGGGPVALSRGAESGSDILRSVETNEDIEKIVDWYVQQESTRIIVMSAALCDFTASIGYEPQGKYAGRLKSENYRDEIIESGAGMPLTMRLKPAEKIIRKIRQKRKDIFLVGFKTTCGLTEDEQYIEGLDLCKKASCNLVLANDVKSRINMIVTPEEARYHVDTDRDKSLFNLMYMTKLRSHLNFTRSTVISGDPIPWDSPEVPESLRTVVNFCIENNAYKPFNGVTAGHFAVKLNDTTFLTSIRKTNFNQLPTVGLVKVVTDGPDTVLAYGAKPSVGGQSQRIVFKDHEGMDCIVHFHCPKKPESEVPTVSQYEYECGSHECGQNTSRGLKQYGNLKAVYLDNHGPNIVFNHKIDPKEVISFIEQNFDLNSKTGGFVSILQRKETDDTLDTAQKVLD